VAALDAAAQGLQAAPGDAVLTGILDQLLRDAQSAANDARTRATAAGGVRQGRFAQGDESLAAARRALDTGQKPNAVRNLWAADQHFSAAAADAEQQALIAQRQETAAREAEAARARAGAARAETGQAAEQRPVPEAQAAPAQASPPTAPAAAPPPPASSSVNDEASIRETLRLYAEAYQRLDPNGVQAIYPTAPMDRVRKAFSDFKSYSLQVQINSLQVSADRSSATVNATLVYDFQPRSGRRAQGNRQQVFVLQRRENTWLIAQLP
jgi:hypothetical protein